MEKTVNAKKVKGLQDTSAMETTANKKGEKRRRKGGARL